MSVRRKGKREFESSLKKKMITDTAISMFRHYGYENTTISDISRATKMSVGSIYNFFGSKEGIVKAAVKELGTYIIEEDALWEDKILNPAGTIKSLLVEFSTFFVSFGPDLSKHMGSALFELYNDRTGAFVETESVRSLTRFIRTCQEHGTILRKRTAEEYTQIILSTLMGVILIWTRFEFDLTERLKSALDVIFCDILPG